MANGQIKYSVGFDIDKSSLNQLKTSLQQLSRTKISDIMKINNVDAQEAHKILNEVKGQAKQVEDALQKAFNFKLNTANIETFKTALKGLDTQTLYKSFSRLGSGGEIAFRQLSTQLLNTNVQLKETHTLLDKMGTTFVNTIKWNVASSAINAMTRSVQQAWGFTKALDTSLNDIRIVTGKSAEEMANFSIKANEAAQSLGKTTTDYTKASLIYAQQGLSDAEIEERAKITLKAANVTGQSTDAVSEELTAVWNGYKVTAEEAELYVDRLAAVAAKSASNLEELSTGMSKVASAAAAMGVGEDQLAAQLSTIISVTRQAPESVGTALRTVYARISDIKAGVDEDGVTLGRYTTKMADLGISVLDMNGKLRDMGEVMEEIGSKWDGMTREQQVYLAQTMAGQRQYNNLLALFDNFQQYNKMLNVAQEGAGTLQKQQDTYMESTAAHLKQLTAALESIYQKLFDTKAINNIIDGLTNATKLISFFIQSLGGGKAALSSLGSIAFMVFSKQIGDSLNTTINNMRVAREQTEFFKKAVIDAQEKANSNIGNLYTQEILGDQSKLMGLAAGGGLSPESFNQIRDSLLELRQAADNIDVVEGKIASIDGVFKNLSPTIKDIIEQAGGLDKVLEDGFQFNRISAEVEKLKTTFDPLGKIISDAEKQWGKFLVSINSKDSTKISQATQNLRKELDSIVEKIKTTTIEGTDIKLLNSLPDHIKEKIEEASKNFNENAFKDLNPIEAQNKVKQYYNTVVITIESEIKRINEAMQTLGKEGADYSKLKQELQQLLRIYKDVQINKNQLLDSATTQAQVQQFTAVTSSITTMIMAVRNLQNLGSIWTNKDLSIGEKLVQTITNLGMAIGMIIPAYTKLNKILNLVRVSKYADSLTTSMAVGTNSAYALSFHLVQGAAGRAAIQVQIFNTVLEMNPIFLAISALIALISAIVGVVSALEKANEELIKASNENIDTQNKIQEEIDKYQELYKQLNQLDNQFTEQKISRTQLKEVVEDLIDEYGLEGEAADRLRGKYDNLKEVIRELRIENAKKGAASAQLELENAETLVTASAKGKVGDYGTQRGNRYELDFNSELGIKTETGERFSYEPQALISALQRIGGEITKSSTEDRLKFDVEFDAQSLTTFYDDLYQVIYGQNGPGSQLSKAEKQTSMWYQQSVQWLDQMKQSVEKYKNALEDTIRYNTELQVFSSQIDLYNIKDLNDYTNKRKELVKLIQDELEKTEEEANEITDIFLRNDFRNQFIQFNEGEKFLQTLRKSFGNFSTEAQNTVEKILNLLNPEQLSFIDSLKIQDISSWEDLQHILEYMQTVDLSNLTIVTNPKQRLEAATEQYNTYSKLNRQNFDVTQKTINDSDYEKLAPGIQEFFTLIGDGTYKMLGDAKKFYNAIDELSVAGFQQNIEDLRASTERLFSLQNINYDNLTQTANYDRTQVKSGIIQNNLWDTQQTSQQLDYLIEAGYDLNKIIQWKAELSDGSAAVSTLQDIANAIQEVGNQTENFSNYLNANQYAIFENQLALARSAESTDILKQSLNNIEQSFKNGQISEEEFKQTTKAVTQAMIELDQTTDLEGLDSKELNDYSNYLQKAAKNANNLSNELETNDDAAKIIAKSIMKMNDGIEDLGKNWDDWSDILINSSEESEEYADAMTNTQNALSNLLDISQDYVSKDFIRDHLDEITAAAEGSEEAIDSLKAALAQDIFARIMLDNQITPDIQDTLLTELANLQASIPDMEVGATLDTGEFLTNAQKLIEDCGMTVDQANALFDALGFEADFATEEKEVTQRVPKTVTVTEVTGYKSGTATDPAGKEIKWSYPILSQYSYNDGYAEQTGKIDVPAMATNGKTPVIKSLTRKAGGGFSNYSSRNAGGSSPSGSKKSSGGSGGSSKSASPDTSQKDRKEALEDDRDIYHDINIEIQQVSRNLDRVQKQQDRLYGKQLLDNLNKQTAILEQHKKKLQEKAEIQQWDLENQRKALETLGVTFDKYGNIINYMTILAQKQADVNKLTEEYNALIDEYNASTDKETKQTIADKAEAVNKQLQAAEDDYKKLKDKISNYDDLREDMEDLQDDIEEDLQQQIEINIQKFNMAVEIHLEMGQAEREWNEFKRKVLNHTDILKDSNFSSIQRDAQQSLNDATSYVNIGGSPGQIQSLTSQVNDIRAEIQAINETGWSSIYGDNKAQAMEDLQKYLSQLMTSMENYLDMLDAIDQAYLDTIDDIEEQFDKQVEGYEYIGELIEHNMDLLSLLYGDKNYAAMQNYYDKLVENNNKQVDFQRQQADFWYDEWQRVLASGDTAAAQILKEKYQKAVGDLNSTIMDAAQTLLDQYTNNVNKIFDDLDRRITNGKGVDYLEMEWELMNKNADQYLDTINSAFAIQDTQRKYQKAIDETQSVKNQQALKKVMNEQLEILKTKEKITQYDVDRAEKVLQVEKARIALEEARNNKTSMRLKRDAQGNYSYEYVADLNAVEDAVANLDKAQNDLYNFDKEAYRSNLDDMLSAWKEFKEKSIELSIAAAKGDEDAQRELALLREKMGEYINGKTQQNLGIRSNLMDSAFKDYAKLYGGDIKAFKAMSDAEKDELMNKLVPLWDSGVQHMTESFIGKESEDGFISACKGAFDEITTATQDYQKSLDKLAKSGGVDLGKIKQGYADINKQIEDAVTNNDELITSMVEEKNEIYRLKKAADALKTSYQGVAKAAQDAVNKAQKLRQEQQKKAAAAAEKQKKSTPQSSLSSSSDSSSKSGSDNNKKEDTSKKSTSKTGSGNGQVQVGDKVTYTGDYYYTSYGDTPTGNIYSGVANAAEVDIVTSNPYGIHLKSADGKYPDLGWVKKKQISGYDTGGYTGQWQNDSGRLAFLHQKELVLNQSDTKNILDSVDIIRSITSALGGTIAAKLGDIRSGVSTLFNKNNDEVEQNVHIEASFPSVNSKKEIEDAFSDLVNLAAQRVFRR